MVDSRGGVAVYTGKNCIPDAGHHAGEQYSVQANLMERSDIKRMRWANSSSPVTAMPPSPVVMVLFA